MRSITLHSKVMRLAVIMMVGFASAMALAQDYEIRLHRPVAPGYKFKVMTSGNELRSMWVTGAGKLLSEQNMQLAVQWEAVATVLSVNKIGVGTSYSYEVGKLVLTEFGIPRELLSKGTVLVTSNSPEKVDFLVNAKPVTTEVSNALAVVMETSAPNNTPEDETFGTDARKRLNESWEANRAKAAEGFKKEISEDKAVLKDLAGKMMLKAVVTNAPVPFMKIASDFTMKTAMRRRNEPFNDVTIVTKTSRELPLDHSLQPMGGTAEFVFSTTKTKTFPDEPDIVALMTARRSITSRLTPVK